MPFLNKQQMMRVEKRTFATLNVPELNGELKLASLSAGAALELFALQKRAAAGEDLQRELMLLMICSSVCDEQGVPMFAGDEDGASAFFETISLESAYAIMKAVPGLQVTKKSDGGAPGEASKETTSADSPSGSV